MLFSLDMTIFNFKINYMRRQQASCFFFHFSELKDSKEITKNAEIERLSISSL